MFQARSVSFFVSLCSIRFALSWASLMSGKHAAASACRCVELKATLYKQAKGKILAGICKKGSEDIYDSAAEHQSNDKLQRLLDRGSASSLKRAAQAATRLKKSRQESKSLTSFYSLFFKRQSHTYKLYVKEWTRDSRLYPTTLDAVACPGNHQPWPQAWEAGSQPFSPPETFTQPQPEQA